MKYKIEFFSNWHCGSGLAAGADVDALVVKDRDGLPYVPGRTIKGLLREAATLLGYKENDIIKVFGKSGERDNQAGQASFRNATIGNKEREEIQKCQTAPYLYQTFAATAIDDFGIAKDNSLRKIETVIPCVVYGTIDDLSADNEEMIKQAMKYVKRMGTGRTRGYGRCCLSPIEEKEIANKQPEKENEVKPLKPMKFECTLLTDIVLSQSSSSMGYQKSLDFIPGNCFLGIVASYLYNKVLPEKAMVIFHSGKVRFGDAHPAHNGTRGLKVPSAMYYPKLKKPSEELYIHHCITNQDALKNDQLKQCREGFYAFVDENGNAIDGMPIDTRKGFIIKSAYDSENRRSADGLLFGYEYLSKGLKLYFEIESDLDEETDKAIVKALTGNGGKRYVGHSRKAEFGQVQIRQIDEYKEQKSGTEAINIKNEQYATVYADSRLIFLNNNGEPTFLPTVAQLFGWAEDTATRAEIDWSKSQVRTFQYAPWNSKRQSYDTDRCGIEKGSVIVINLNGEQDFPKKSQYVGAYENEGFGRVIYNPEFLMPKNGTNGEAKYRLQEKPDEKKHKREEDFNPTTDLAKLLEARRNVAKSQKQAYGIVEKTADKWESMFRGNRFASQWGSIRSLAMINTDPQELKKEIKSFLSHGVAEEKWNEMGRKKTLEDFLDGKHIEDENAEEKKRKIEEFNQNLQDTMINLAAEMAKRCKED